MIATQGLGPGLVKSMCDFERNVLVRRLWAFPVVLVGLLAVMLQMKCQRYWPEVQKEAEFGPILVVTVSEDRKPHYILRELLIQKAAPEVFEGEDGVEEGYDELVSALRGGARGEGQEDGSVVRDSLCLFFTQR